MAVQINQVLFKIILKQVLQWVLKYLGWMFLCFNYNVKQISIK